MSCGLSIIGTHLDIDTFVKKTKISGFSKSYKGDDISKANPRKRKYSFVSITISEADFDDINGQINDTIIFLNKYKGNLKHITTTPEIEYATISFGLDSVIDEEHLTQSFYFPLELIKICAELGISIETTLYKNDMEIILEKKHKKKSI